MQIYLYVPESLDVSDFFAESQQLNINQIVHGHSDIIKDLVKNYSKVQKINVPEFYGVWIENVVAPSDTDIPMVFIDEWIEKEKKYKRIFAEVYQIDLENPKKSSLIEVLDFTYDNQYSYYHKFKFKNIGEYRIDLISELQNNEKKLIESKDIIIYRNRDV